MERERWIRFIHNLLDDKYDIYVKGGSVLGLYLQDVRDWDFVIYTSKPNFQSIIKTAKQYDIIQDSKQIVILRSTNYIKINNDALFEMAIKENEIMSDLELPMTTMKLKLNKDNMNTLFDLALSIYCNNISFDGITVISMTNIEIPESDNGFFKVTELDHGGLSLTMLDIIRQTTSNMNEQQFLITHLKQPDRLFCRLPKNCRKTIDLAYTQQTVLLNVTLVNQLVEQLITNIHDYVNKIFIIDYTNKKEYELSLIRMFNQIDFGINLGRLSSIYHLLPMDTKLLIKRMMPSIIKQRYIKALQSNNFYHLWYISY